jgi:DUF1009 family protein
MYNANASLLAFQAGATFVVDLERVLHFADEHGIAIVAYQDR